MAGKLAKIKLNDYMPLREVVFNSLREAIISGELEPGERLMEVQLAEKMGVSRTPVREAIRKLELEGLVIMIPRKGTHVAELSSRDIIDVLEVRANLDGLATALATDRITPEELKSLELASRQLEINIKKQNIHGIIKKDVEFHDIIYTASRNERLINIIFNLREQVQRYRVIYLNEFSHSNEVLKEHNAILNAMQKKDRSLAQHLAENHITNQQDAIVAELKYKG